MIKNREVVTKVLGTSFNIKEQEGNVKVSVATGKVKVFTQSNNNLYNEAYLLPGQQANYDLENQSMETKSVNIDDIIAWKNDVLFFHKANFGDVVMQLEKWYGVKIQVNKNIEGEFSGRFKEKTLDSVLEGLSYTTPFNYEIKSKSVTIY